MSLIEGVGDEVLQFFGLVFATLLGLFAWWSTNITDLPQLRTVLILGRLTQTSQTESSEQNSSNTTNRRESGGGETNETVVTAEEKKEGEQSKLLPESEQSSVGNSSVTEENKTESSTTNCGEATTEESSRTTTEESSRTTTEESSQTTTEESSRTTTQEEEQNLPSAESPDNIRIRLKYLNDEQKLVEGSLQEQLGDFKRRNFRVEISRHQRVRLIFNGRVLQSDNRTLQGCGLYDNCVVHCLVQSQSNPNANGAQAHANNAPSDWNLGGLLYALLSIIFGIAWFFRYHYSHLFNIITTGTLIGLTVMFAGSVIGLYMPDQEVPR